jgi:hypothetical protein
VGTSKFEYWNKDNLVFVDRNFIEKRVNGSYQIKDDLQKKEFTKMFQINENGVHHHILILCTDEIEDEEIKKRDDALKARTRTECIMIEFVGNILCHKISFNPSQYRIIVS